MKRVKIVLLAAVALTALPGMALAQDQGDRHDHADRGGHPPPPPRGDGHGNGRFNAPPGQPPQGQPFHPGGPGGQPGPNGAPPPRAPGDDGRDRFGGWQGRQHPDWNQPGAHGWQGRDGRDGGDGRHYGGHGGAPGWNGAPGRPDDGRDWGGFPQHPDDRGHAPPDAPGGVHYDDHRPGDHRYPDNHWGTGQYRDGPGDARGFGGRHDGWDHRPGFGARGPGWSDHNGHGWNGGWRNDRRYDWRGWRDQHRDLYRWPYRPPAAWGYGYRSVYRGAFLEPYFFASSYWLDNPYEYRLPPVEWPLRWVRYYDDALLVDITSGEVVDVIQGFFF